MMAKLDIQVAINDAARKGLNNSAQVTVKLRVEDLYEIMHALNLVEHLKQALK